MEGAQITTCVRKSKKKQVKDQFDRIKQAEKKKRRLEKALATSAAIRNELEMKKQRKKEELERLDEQGAAIAEAVALHVLIGEDSDDSCRTMLNKDEGLSYSWDRLGNMVPYRNSSEYSLESIRFRVCDAYRFGQSWNQWGKSNSTVLASNLAGRDLYPRYLGHYGWGSIGLSADHIAAECVSSLNIADDSSRRDSYMFNHMLRG